jgi:hypothetical protein
MFKNIIVIFILFFSTNSFGQATKPSEGVTSRVTPQVQNNQNNDTPAAPKKIPRQEPARASRRRRKEKEKKTKKLKKKAGSSSVPIRYSYSGADCKAIAYFDNNSNYNDNNDVVHLEGLATISYSVYEAKSPVRRLGERSVAGYTKGIRTVAGSMIFLVIEDHPLAELIKKENKTEVYSSDNDSKGVSYKVTDGINRYLSTMLKPFNIGLFYKTEVSFSDNSESYEYSTVYKTGFNEMAHLVISGVEIISEGMVTSVNDMVTEVSMQFVAHDVFNIEKQESGKSVYSTEAKSNEVKRKEEVNPEPSTKQDDEKQEVIASTDTDSEEPLVPPSESERKATNAAWEEFYDESLKGTADELKYTLPENIWPESYGSWKENLFPLRRDNK